MNKISVFLYIIIINNKNDKSKNLKSTNCNAPLSVTSLLQCATVDVDLTVIDRDQDEQEQIRHWQGRI
jgi:hypothetical protein